MRLLDDATLAELGRDPVERVRDALARDDVDAASDLAARARRGWSRSVDGFRVWIVHTLAFLSDRFGASDAGLALTVVTRTTDRWIPWSVEPAPAPTDSPLLDALLADERTARDDHDRWLDAVCALLTHVYRTHGVDGLQESMEYAGDQTLLAWMPDDIGRDPVARVRTWAAMLQGNFATVRVEEDEEKFVITQDPCGSCGRQLLAGRFPGPFDHATVAEAHPITFERGDVPVYRTHVAVMHFLVPEARLGVPWPVVACPRGTVARRHPVPAPPVQRSPGSGRAGRCRGAAPPLSPNRRPSAREESECTTSSPSSTPTTCPTTCAPSGTPPPARGCATSSG